MFKKSQNSTQREGITDKTPPPVGRKMVKDKESTAAALLTLRTQMRSGEVSLLKLSAQHSLHFRPKQEVHSLPASFRMSQGAIFLPPLPSRMPETN